MSRVDSKLHKRLPTFRNLSYPPEYFSRTIPYTIRYLRRVFQTDLCSRFSSKRLKTHQNIETTTSPICFDEQPKKVDLFRASKQLGEELRPRRVLEVSREDNI